MSGIFRFLIFSNLFISISAVMLAIAAYPILSLERNSVSIDILALIFCSTFFIYNIYLSFLKKHIVNSERLKWAHGNKKIIFPLFILSGLFSVMLLLIQRFEIILVLIPLAIIAVFYSFPFNYFGIRIFSLRDIPFLKIFLIAIVWAGSTVFIPAVDLGISIIDSNVIWLFVERVFFILALTIPFDIRDYEADKMVGLLTIPGYLGVKKSKYLSLFFIAVYFLITIFHYPIESVIYGRLVAVLATAIIIWNAKVNGPYYYYLFLSDGIIILQSALILIIMKIQ